MTLNLTAKGTEQEILKKYLEENASEVLAEKINNGVRIVKDGVTLISRKTLDGFMRYATEEAKKQAEKGARSACIHSDVVFGWCIHYFEEDSIEGTLYNEDGTEYKAVPATKTETVKPIAPTTKAKPKEESPQLSLFDFSDDLTDTEPSETPPEDDEDETEEEPITEVKPVEKPAISPLYQRYLHHQEEFPNTIVAMRVGDFFEVFGDAAVTVAHELEMTLTSRDFGLPERVKMVGFPFHVEEVYREKIRAFANVAIIDTDNMNFYPQRKPLPFKVDTETGEVLEPIDEPDELAAEIELAKAFDKDALCLLAEILDNKFVVR